MNRLCRYGLAAGAALLLTLMAAKPGDAREVLPGPQPAQLVEVIDGDTIRVRARIWLGTDVEALVRIDGMDAPELKGKCASERALAQRARRRIASLTEGQQLMLYDIRYGKYAGRVVARVEVLGLDIAAILIAEGLAHPYDGGSRGGWCGAG